MLCLTSFTMSRRAFRRYTRPGCDRMPRGRSCHTDLGFCDRRATGANVESALAGRQRRGLDSDVSRLTSSSAERFRGLTRMMPLQLFVLFGLPLLIGVGGVLAAARFRLRHAKRAQASPTS